MDLYFSLKEADIKEILDNKYDQLFESISNWLKIECNEPLLVNYSIIERTTEEIDQYENKLKNLQSSLSKKSNDDDNDDFDETNELDYRFKNQNEIMSNIGNMYLTAGYFGVTNEFYVYTKLLDLDINANTIYHDYYERILKQFNQRIHSRLRINLDEIIKFRTMFDFRKFGKLKIDFEKKPSKK